MPPAVTNSNDPALLEDCIRCLRAGIRAADPERLVRETLGADTPPAGPVYLAAFGKAAVAMARGAAEAWRERIAEGIILTTQGSGPFRTMHGSHPQPDRSAVTGARAIRDLALRASSARAELLCLISGGGSSLLTLPPETIPLDDVGAITHALLQSGADIRELNCVRKHLDQLKGGRLAQLAAPARVRALVLSDVVGDSLDVIASGPISPDPTTYADAVRILENRGLWANAPPPIREHLEAGVRGTIPESPKPGDRDLAGTIARIIGSARTAAEGAARKARALGYAPRIATLALTGEARRAGQRLGRLARRTHERAAARRAWITAGETVVTVRGEGTGGRNQELTLAAALEIDGARGIAVGSVGTDGIDGPTDAAGAVAGGTTISRARARHLDAAACLADNDSYRLFAALADHIHTGPTGTNVMDLQVILVDPT